jgi:hypothetical protein
MTRKGFELNLEMKELSEAEVQKITEEKERKLLHEPDDEYSIYIKDRFNELHLAYQKAGILSETKEDLIFE